MNLKKTWSLIFTVFYIKKFYLLYSCPNPLGKILFLRYRPKFLCQSDCRICKWTISPEQIDEVVMLKWPFWSLDSKIELTNGINLFFAYWFMKISMKVLGVGMVKNRCGQSCDGTLKLTISEEWTDGINWFFACWYRFRKIKSWSKNFWVGIVKNGCGQSKIGCL